MNRQKWTMFSIVFVLVGGAAFYLHGWGMHQMLGKPGILARPIADSVVMDIQLPEQVLDYASTLMEQPESVTNMLPQDTSLATRRYDSPERFQDGTPFTVQLSAVMMGKDRTSIHKPEYCLPGQGWEIVNREPMTIAMPGTPAYALPAMKWTLSKMYTDAAGHSFPIKGIYVFWFAADNELTNSHSQRLWWLWRDLLKTGVLERWSYISYYCAFLPENEASASEQLKKFVEASAPQFQLPPRPNDAAIAAK